MSPDYSIIIPAYNEEELLPETLDSVKQAMASIGMIGQLIVVDNNSDDSTARIAKESGAKVVFEPINQISRARNAGAGVAEGGYLVFLDADTIITPALLQKALGYLSSGQYCGGGVQVTTEEEISENSRKLLDIWNNISVKYGLAAGCFVYCLKEGFEGIGGFSEKVYASEEIWLSRRLKKWGKKRNLGFTIIGEPMIKTSMRKLNWFSSSYVTFYFFFFAVFPATVFFRRLCRPWYYRPGSQSQVMMSKD